MAVDRRGILAAAALGMARRARAATVFRWATVLPVSHPSVTMMNAVVKTVAEQTGGAVSKGDGIPKYHYQYSGVCINSA